MKQLKFLPLIVLGACIKHGEIAHGQDEASTFGSPCIDGTIMNMSAVGCVEFDAVNHASDGYLALECSQALDSNWWTAVRFRAYSTSVENITLSESWNMFCVDTSTVVFAMPK